MMQNGSIIVTEFTIGGFDETKRPLVVGWVILITYVLVILANMLNVVFIINDERLHKPMYLLICNLAFVDILYSSSSTPTMIGVLVSGVTTISYASCFAQMFFFHLSGVMEMFALSVMAFDRLLAVSYPFQYTTYLTNTRTLVLAIVVWVLAGICVIWLVVATVPLPHCHSRLKYPFCDFPGILRTTCVDLRFYFNTVTIILFFLIFFTFSFICLTYFCIIYFMKLSSSNEKRKMGGTCVSHLIVVAGFYVPLFFHSCLATLGVKLTLEARQGLVIGTILGPSLLNPLVYCLRTTEIRNKLFNIVKRVELCTSS